MKKGYSKKDVPWAFKTGLFFCLVQVLICLAIAPKSEGVSGAYLRLNRWDSVHYQSIMDKGYHLPQGPLTADDVHSDRANVGYFPAYPILAKGIQNVSGFSTPVSLLVTAQFFSFLFWFQIFLLLRLWNVSRKNALFVGLTVALYPASFFLVTGYSESIFLASLVGLILGLEMGFLKRGWFLAALSGFVLSATRLVGIPLMLYPMIRWFFLSRTLRGEGLRSILLALATVSGGFGFFFWCFQTFGIWDIYFKLQRLGWGNEPNFTALLDPRSYIPRLFFEDTTTSVCRASNLFILALFIFAFKAEFTNRRKGGAKRIGLYFAAFSMFFISLSGKANYNMDSMVRYNLPVFALLVLAFTHLSIEKGYVFKKQGFNSFWIVGYFLAFAVQIWMILLFTKGGWVA